MKANAPKRKVFQDALDLLTEDMAVDLSYLSDEEQKLIHHASEAEGRKIQAKQAAGFRKLAGKITKENRLSES